MCIFIILQWRFAIVVMSKHTYIPDDEDYLVKKSDFEPHGNPGMYRDIFSRHLLKPVSDLRLGTMMS